MNNFQAKQVEHAIEDIESTVFAHKTKITDWESDFLYSIQGQEHPLTEKQTHKLNKISEKVK